MLRRVFRSVTLALAVLFVGAGIVVAAEWPKTWQSTELRDHPLVGKIYDVRAKRFVGRDGYLAALPKTLNVLLGEVHDNPDHHVLQAVAIANLKPRAVVFEHFRSDQQTVLDAYQTGQKWMGTAGGDDQIERLFLVTGWEKSGWPDKGLFAPLVEAVLISGAKIVAGNVPRRRIYAVAKDGLAALSEDARRAMRLDRPLGGGLDDALLDELEASHCGLMPKSAFGNMAMAQRFRDAHLADAMTGMRATSNEAPVVLVAGNGHVRGNRGVPWYIAQAYANARLRVPATISVGHVEVVEGETDPMAYLDAPGQYSFVVFTPRVKRVDPCVAMRKRFGKRKKK